MDQVAKHAASSEKHGENLLALISELEETKTRPGVDDVFTSAVQNMGLFQESFRPGGLDGLKRVFIDRVMHLVPMLMDTSVDALNASHVSTIEKALGLCAGSNSKLTDLTGEVCRMERLHCRGSCRKQAEALC